ncbi:MAG: hypothetical protein GX985_00035 [Gallicola sp.]|uniref:DUF6320 domain-containing protein n=1 Tax=Gallicola sp. Sow4_E12 TaxID=3438785 RepID=UPI0017D130BB|nr:hypothetical protein [Gallicola sp.]
MSYCKKCDVKIQGDQDYCPLCDEWLEEIKKETNPYPNIPLKFNRYKLTNVLLLLSFLLVVGLLAINYFFLNREGEVFQAILIGVATLWLSVTILIRKRRNIAKSFLYLLVTLNLLAIYTDIINGWRGWSLSFALPFSCIIVLFALVLSLKFVRLSLIDGLLYLMLAAVLSVIPGILLLLGIAKSPVPAYLSTFLGISLLLFTLVQYGDLITLEIKKRFRI